MFKFNLIEKLKIIFHFRKKSKTKGGNGGDIFIAGGELKGGGTISADGSRGEVGGEGGSVTIITDKNNFEGQISAQGGGNL